VRKYVLEALGRDRLAERAAKLAIKCRLEAAIDRLDAAAPVRRQANRDPNAKIYAAPPGVSSMADHKN
jgi:hypothetical protein